MSLTRPDRYLPMIDWGSVPEWVQAVATIGALLAAGVALIYTVRAARYAAEANRTAAIANDITAAAYKADVKERREAQARFVYALSEVPLVHHPGEVLRSNIPSAAHEAGVFVEGSFVSLPGGEWQRTVAAEMLSTKVTVHNRSEEIVAAWMVSLYDRNTGEPVGALGLGEGALPLLPGESRIVRIDVLRHEEQHPHIGPVLEFRDSSGRMWRRRGSDPVELLRDSDAT